MHSPTSRFRDSPEAVLGMQPDGRAVAVACSTVLQPVSPAHRPGRVHARIRKGRRTLSCAEGSAVLDSGGCPPLGQRYCTLTYGAWIITHRYSRNASPLHDGADAGAGRINTAPRLEASSQNKNTPASFHENRLKQKQAPQTEHSQSQRERCQCVSDSLNPRLFFTKAEMDKCSSK